MGQSALQSLARFASQLEADALPADIGERARACLLYALAVGIAASETKAARLAVGALESEYEGARGSSTRLLDGARVAAGLAAFANAALVHARIQEDAHPAGHLGVVVIPAALAVAERVEAAGNDLLAAIVAGYETGLRIGRDHAGALSERGFRTSACYGPFAAAAAASRLMRLDEARTLNALAMAAHLAGGLREFVNAGTEEYPFQAGFAARDGIAAASCAEHGIAAAPSNLDGAAGFYRAFGGDSEDYGRRIAEGLGESFEMREITYKPYPACQFLRSVIRGVLELRERTHQAQLETMAIRLHPFEADFFGVKYRGPFTTFSQTFMSAPFAAALAWVTGRASHAGMHDFANAAVLRAIPFISVISDAARPRYHPRIEIVCADGGRHAWEQSAGDDFELTWEAAVAMTHTLCEEAGVSASAAALVGHVDRIAAPGAVRRLTSYVATTIQTVVKK